MSNGPDFICIGAEKAGTTWLYDNIRHHPEVWLPPPPFKELHYFDDRVPHKQLLHVGRFPHGGILRRYSPLVRSPSWKTLRWVWRFNYHHNDSMHWYRSLFTQKDKISGDITPSYSTLDERGIEYARKVVGDQCKVFLILRDPVSRFWSSVKMLYRYRRIDIRREAPSKVVNELHYPDMALKSDYPKMIEIWQSVFGDSMFRIFFYDDLVADDQAFLGTICRFIGLKDDAWVSPQLNRESNKDREQIKIPDEIKIAVSRHFLPELEKLSNLVGGHSVTWLQKAGKAVEG